MKKVDRNNFKQEIFQEDEKVILYIWADDCEYCRMMRPYIEEVEEKYEDQYKFCKLNTREDAGVAIAALYGVDTTPTTLLMDCGDVLGRATGMMMPVELIKALGLPSEEEEEAPAEE